MSDLTESSAEIEPGTCSKADREHSLGPARFDHENGLNVLCSGDTAVGKTEGTKIHLTRHLQSDPNTVAVAISFFGEYQTLVDEFNGGHISVDSGEDIPDGLGTAKFTSITVQQASITPDEFLRLYLEVYLQLAKLTDKRAILVVEDVHLLASAELDDAKTRERFEASLGEQANMTLSIQFITQDPRQLLGTAIGRAIVEQCPNKLFYRSSGFHTNDAETFGLSPRQVNIVRQLRSGDIDTGGEALLTEANQNSEPTVLTIQARPDERALIGRPTPEPT